MTVSVRRPPRASILLPLWLLLPLGLVLGYARERISARAASEVSLGQALETELRASEQLELRPSELAFIDRPSSGLANLWRDYRVVFRGKHLQEPSDIYVARVGLTPEGHLLRVDRVYSLSDTTAVEERQLRVAGTQAIYAVEAGARVTAIHLREFREAPMPGNLDRLTCLQHRLTWLQETGQSEGIGQRVFRVDPPAERVEFAYHEGQWLVELDGHVAQIADGKPPSGAARLEEESSELGSPGNVVTWAVDRVRALPWFGSDRMQLVKAVAFGALDLVQRWQGRLTGDDGAAVLAQQAEGLVSLGARVATNPETGWPPAPVTPLMKPLAGEGQWKELDDAFVAREEAGHGSFLFTFLRPDTERQYTQVFITLWDPRQLELATMSGTREPKTATGETGPGLVPRNPERIGRLVAAFNGGFQAAHGEFGMMAANVVYLPPKPYAATVARLRDGSTAFGTWPDDEQIPEEVVDFRQNLTPMIMDGVVNPYHRTWWGGVPPGWEDATRTVRTGLCLTAENFVAYFYGSSIDADHLATTMKQARCQYGVHLDMNPGHTGLEFYRVAPKGQLPKLGHAMDSQWEAQGPLTGLDGWDFMGRRMIRLMNLMHFPRYVRTESRDFFYLTRRRLLPPNALSPVVSPPEPDEGKWQTHGLAQHGWPYALATNWLRPEPSRPQLKVTLVAFDPRYAGVAQQATAATLVLARLRRPGAGSRGLYFAPSGPVFSDAPPKDAQRVASGLATPSAKVTSALGLLGDELVLYAEVTSGGEPQRDGLVLQRLLQQLGASAGLYLERPLGLRLGPGEASSDDLLVVRQQGPGGRRFFSETAIVPPQEWVRLQAKRVRYFPKPKAASAASASAVTPPAAPSVPAAEPPSP